MSSTDTTAPKTKTPPASDPIEAAAVPLAPEDQLRQGPGVNKSIEVEKARQAAAQKAADDHAAKGRAEVEDVAKRGAVADAKDREVRKLEADVRRLRKELADKEEKLAEAKVGRNGPRVYRAVNVPGGRKLISLRGVMAWTYDGAEYPEGASGGPEGIQQLRDAGIQLELVL